MGAQHDMRLAKRHLTELYPYKIVIADKGYQGLAKTGLQTPKKKSKHHSLNKQDKEANRRLGKFRTVIEHINRKLKIFKYCRCLTATGGNGLGFAKVSKSVPPIFDHNCEVAFKTIVKI